MSMTLSFEYDLDVVTVNTHPDQKSFGSRVIVRSRSHSGLQTRWTDCSIQRSVKYHILSLLIGVYQLSFLISECCQ